MRTNRPTGRPLHRRLALAAALLGTLVSCGEKAGSEITTWTVHFRGFGPLLAGMRVEDAAKVVPGSLSVPAGAVPEACTYLVWDAAPPGVRVMAEDGAVTRIDVMDGRAVATAGGARIGDSEARIDSLYAGRIERRPHKYTDGSYLIVRADTARPLPGVTDPGATPPDTRSDFRLVFETDGAQVTRFRAGLFPAVEYVEGCA